MSLELRLTVSSRIRQASFARRVLTHCILAVALLAFMQPRARGVDTPPPDLRAWFSEAQLLFDNDTWAKTDRYYTNGFKFGGAVHLGNIWGPLRAPAAAVFGLRHREQRPEALGGIFIGQNMYTPRQIGDPRPQPFDRPWAAWLYLGTVLQIVQPNEEALDSVEFDIGMVGPAALGKEVQTKVHEIFGARTPRGWHNQIPNEPGFLIAYVHKEKVGNDTVDVVPHAGVTLGTVLTLARVGATARFGRNLTGFGPDRIEPSGALLQNTRSSAQRQARPPLEYYAFAAADLRYVAYNIFLDGTVFRDSPSVDKRHYVHDLSAGVSMRYGAFRFTIARVHRSEEFTTPLGGGGSQSFYALGLAYEPGPPARGQNATTPDK